MTTYRVTTIIEGHPRVQRLSAQQLVPELVGKWLRVVTDRHMRPRIEDFEVDWRHKRLWMRDVEHDISVTVDGRAVGDTEFKSDVTLFIEAARPYIPVGAGQ